MPELPEIETIKFGLQKEIIGLKITKVEVLNKKTFQGDSKSLIGKKVVSVWRRAKILGIEVKTAGPALIILFHLKMTGQLIFEDGKRLVGGHPTPDMKGQMPNLSTRVIFYFSNGSKLYFNDQRKFGWVKLVMSDELWEMSFIKNLGPEPLEKEFDWQVLKDRLAKRKNLPIKVDLMDQTIISGLGNIYANEACFNASIDPRRKVATLSDKEYKSLYKGIVKALKDGIKSGGATRAHFVNSKGEKGYFLDYAFVYGKDKIPCKRCKTIIKKLSLGGRGTYFCEKCQK